MNNYSSYTPFYAAPQSSNEAWNNYQINESWNNYQESPVIPTEEPGCDYDDYDKLISELRPKDPLALNFPIVVPPTPKENYADRKRKETYAETYVKMAVHHFNSVEDTQFEFTGLITFKFKSADTCSVGFSANQPEKGATDAHFAAEVVEDEVRSCTVYSPYELVVEFQAKHAISKYNKEKGAAYEVVEIPHYHKGLILGRRRGGRWSHINFIAVSRSSSDKSPVLFFAEVNAEATFDKEIGCCIVDPQHPEATYQCEICPRQENICHPSQSPVGGLVRGPAFAADHFDGSDIFLSCY